MRKNLTVINENNQYGNRSDEVVTTYSLVHFHNLEIVKISLPRMTYLIFHE